MKKTGMLAIPTWSENFGLTCVVPGKCQFFLPLWSNLGLHTKKFRDKSYLYCCDTFLTVVKKSYM
jgi:hypothetical protein